MISPSSPWSTTRTGRRKEPRETYQSDKYCLLNKVVKGEENDGPVISGKEWEYEFKVFTRARSYILNAYSWNDREVWFKAFIKLLEYKKEVLASREIEFKYTEFEEDKMPDDEKYDLIGKDFGEEEEPAEWKVEEGEGDQEDVKETDSKQKETDKDAEIEENKEDSTQDGTKEQDKEQENSNEGSKNESGEPENDEQAEVVEKKDKKKDKKSKKSKKEKKDKIAEYLTEELIMQQTAGTKSESKDKPKKSKRDKSRKDGRKKRNNSNHRDQDNENLDGGLPLKKAKSNHPSQASKNPDAVEQLHPHPLENLKPLNTIKNQPKYDLVIEDDGSDLENEVEKLEKGQKGKFDSLPTFTNHQSESSKQPQNKKSGYDTELQLNRRMTYNNKTPGLGPKPQDNNQLLNKWEKEYGTMKDRKFTVKNDFNHDEWQTNDKTKSRFTGYSSNAYGAEPDDNIEEDIPEAPEEDHYPSKFQNPTKNPNSNVKDFEYDWDDEESMSYLKKFNDNALKENYNKYGQQAVEQPKYGGSGIQNSKHRKPNLAESDDWDS